MERRNTNIDVWLTCENPDCPHLDGIFLVNYVDRDHRYCSKRCGTLGRSQKTGNRNTKIDVWLTCANPDCNHIDGVFLINYRYRNQVYCSRGCRSTVVRKKMWLKERNVNIGIYLTCENPDCLLPDKVFLVDYGLRNKRKYCSQSCSSHVIMVNKHNDPTFLLKQREAMAALWETPEYREKMANAIRTPEGRLSQSINLKKLRQDPEFTASYLKGLRTPEVRAKSSRRLKEKWEDPDYRSKMIQHQEEMWNNPDTRSKIAQSCKESMLNRWKDPDFRSKMELSNKERWEDPDYRSKMSQAGKERWEDPEFVNKMAEIASSTMKKSHESNVFGLAQRLLFNELNSRMPNIFGWEKRISLNELIRKKYNCNHKYYLLDIPVIINEKIIHNFEVDGPLGHSSPKEKNRDTLRDLINLNENEFATTRFTNEEIFTDVKKVADKAMEIIKPLLNKRN